MGLKTARGLKRYCYALRVTEEEMTLEVEEKTQHHHGTIVIEEQQLSELKSLTNNLFHTKNKFDKE